MPIDADGITRDRAATLVGGIAAVIRENARDTLARIQEGILRLV